MMKKLVFLFQKFVGINEIQTEYFKVGSEIKNRLVKGVTLGSDSDTQKQETVDLWPGRKNLTPPIKTLSDEEHDTLKNEISTAGWIAGAAADAINRLPSKWQKGLTKILIPVILLTSCVPNPQVPSVNVMPETEKPMSESVGIGVVEPSVDPESIPTPKVEETPIPIEIWQPPSLEQAKVSVIDSKIPENYKALAELYEANVVSQILPADYARLIMNPAVDTQAVVEARTISKAIVWAYVISADGKSDGFAAQPTYFDELGNVAFFEGGNELEYRQIPYSSDSVIIFGGLDNTIPFLVKGKVKINENEVYSIYWYKRLINEKGTLGKWRFLPDLSVPYTNGELALINGEIFQLGDKTEVKSLGIAAESLSSVEVGELGLVLLDGDKLLGVWNIKDKSIVVADEGMVTLKGRYYSWKEGKLEKILPPLKEGQEYLYVLPDFPIVVNPETRLEGNKLTVNFSTAATEFRGIQSIDVTREGVIDQAYEGIMNYVYNKYGVSRNDVVELEGIIYDKKAGGLIQNNQSIKGMIDGVNKVVVEPNEFSMLAELLPEEGISYMESNNGFGTTNTLAWFDDNGILKIVMSTKHDVNMKDNEMDAWVIMNGFVTTSALVELGLVFNMGLFGPGSRLDYKFVWGILGCPSGCFNGEKGYLDIK